MLCYCLDGEVEGYWIGTIWRLMLLVWRLVRLGMWHVACNGLRRVYQGK